MDKHTQANSQSVATRTKSVATALAGLCLLLVLSMLSTATIADGGANNRKEAISQALARSDDNASVLGVKQIISDNGSVVFAVKIISSGRVKVIRIPKNKSE